MDCNVIKDLIPLYIDNCCSQESERLVKEHLSSCEGCRKIHAEMTAAVSKPNTENSVIGMKKINTWKASVIQSVLLFLTFGLITLGVSQEAGGGGLLNGFWAGNLVVPSTGLLLSLANWYFLPLYKSKKSFSNACFAATAAITLGASVWVAFHYDFSFSNYFQRIASEGFIEASGYLTLFGGGLVLTAVFCILSKLLSGKYAELLGKK